MDQHNAPSEIDLGDLIVQELKYHPLGEKVLELIQDRGVAPTDFAALARIISDVSGTDTGTDPRIILMLSLLLETLVKYLDDMNSKQLKTQLQNGKSKGNNLSGTSS